MEPPRWRVQTGQRESSMRRCRRWSDERLAMMLMASSWPSIHSTSNRRTTSMPFASLDMALGNPVPVERRPAPFYPSSALGTPAEWVRGQRSPWSLHELPAGHIEAVYRQFQFGRRVARAGDCRRMSLVTSSEAHSSRAAAPTDHVVATRDEVLDQSSDQYPSSIGASTALPVASIVNHTSPMPWPLVSPGAVSAA